MIFLLVGSQKVFEFAEVLCDRPFQDLRRINSTKILRPCALFGNLWKLQMINELSMEISGEIKNSPFATRYFEMMIPEWLLKTCVLLLSVSRSNWNYLIKYGDLWNTSFPKFIEHRLVWNYFFDILVDFDQHSHSTFRDSFVLQSISHNDRAKSKIDPKNWIIMIENYAIIGGTSIASRHKCIEFPSKMKKSLFYLERLFYSHCRCSYYATLEILIAIPLWLLNEPLPIGTFAHN